jgi:hypothetical protein
MILIRNKIEPNVWIMKYFTVEFSSRLFGEDNIKGIIAIMLSSNPDHMRSQLEEVRIIEVARSRVLRRRMVLGCGGLYII